MNRKHIINLCIVISLMFAYTVMATAKSPKRKQQPAINWPILCTPSASDGQAVIRGNTLIMPYTITCNPGTSDGCTYSLTWQIFQWIFYNNAWQYRIIDDNAQTWDVDCGTSAITSYSVPNITDYGHGSYFTVLTVWPSKVPGVGNPMAIEWFYFNQ